VVAIAHRMETVSNYDRILVLEDGKVVVMLQLYWIPVLLKTHDPMILFTYIRNLTVQT